MVERKGEEKRMHYQPTPQKIILDWCGEYPVWDITELASGMRRTKNHLRRLLKGDIRLSYTMSEKFRKIWAINQSDWADGSTLLFRQEYNPKGNAYSRLKVFKRLLEIQITP